MLARNRNQSERDSPLKARLDGRNRLPANVLGCLGQVWSCQLLLLLAGGGGS